MSVREDILALLAKLERSRKAAQKREAAIKNDIRRLRENLRDCPHNVTTTSYWEWDNGYGTQKRKEMLTCSICGKRNKWPSISGSWY